MNRDIVKKKLPQLKYLQYGPDNMVQGMISQILLVKFDWNGHSESIIFLNCTFTLFYLFTKVICSCFCYLQFLFVEYPSPSQEDHLIMPKTFEITLYL